MTDPFHLITEDCAYRRSVEEIDRTVSFRPVELNRDLERLHAWFRTDHVRPYWDLAGPLPELRRAIAQKLSDDHLTPYVGRLDGVPMSYWERYWPADDPLAEHYDVRDGDQGVHLLIGPEEYLQQGYATHLLRGIVDLSFRHVGTERVVAEPDAGNEAAIATFESVGFERRDTFYFPHEDKDAALLVCDREAFERSGGPTVNGGTGEVGRL
ncbi:acetyltransferase (plasmid) [Halostagnicola larsenii XH-48]|uniref:Acetyltransferase n=1 Tax=Halostagnicola larsenii XH-48 TaxID=797299 RepID=W0JS88_9EURY|nr:GNAT family N-acetyltransferase [Halostagnicola larsenii]AHG01474.1 acetyltransferase [Halostagnicola larsenii XH-48]